MNILSTLKNIIAITPIPMAIVDTQMNYLAVSEQWVSVYHLQKKTLIGKSHYEVFPEITDRWKKIHQLCLEGKDDQCKEDKFERTDGTVLWLKWEVRHWRTEDGSIGGMMMYSEDITHKKNITLNEKRFQLFMDHFPGLCWITDDQNELKYANKNFFETLNLSRNVVGKKHSEIFGEEIAKNAHISNMDVLKNKQNKEFYQTIRDQNGHPKYFKTYKFPFSQNKEVGNLVGSISFDITKNKQLEEDLYQSERQFKQAFENSLIGMAIISPEGKWKRANNSLCEILGYSEQELQQLNVQDITYEDDLASNKDLLISLASGNIENVKVEKRYLHKNGTIIWVIISATMLKDSIGKPLHFVSQIEDITKRKEIEEDLLLSEKKYRTIFENVQDVFYQTNAQGLVTEISPSIEKYSGYNRNNVINQPVNNFYYYLQDRERILKTLKAKGSVIDFEVRLKTRNKELRYASVNARLIIEDGEIKGTEGSMRDVTTRKFHENALKDLNSELTASNEQQNKLLSIIGHDLRNPISGSLQLLNLTLMDYESTSADELHMYLSQMKQELSNANNLLEDLLSWAKSQFKSMSFNPVEIPNIESQIQKSILTVNPMAEKKGIEITLDVAEGLNLYADSGMLDTILRNLLTNAIKFTNKDGKITVNAKSYALGTEFSISDTGLGMSAAQINMLFKKNTNYTTFGTLGEKGTGLGLNICHDFALKHGGKLWVESEPGKGSTFYFTIPKLK